MAGGGNTDMDDITSSAHHSPHTAEVSTVEKVRKKERKSGRKELNVGKQLLNPSFFRFRFYFIDFPEHSFNFDGSRYSQCARTRFALVFEWYNLLSFSFAQISRTKQEKERERKKNACIVKSQPTIRKVRFNLSSPSNSPMYQLTSNLNICLLPQKIPAKREEKITIEPDVAAKTSTVIISAEIRKRGSQT